MELKVALADVAAAVQWAGKGEWDGGVALELGWNWTGLRNTVIPRIDLSLRNTSNFLNVRWDVIRNLACTVSLASF